MIDKILYSNYYSYEDLVYELSKLNTNIDNLNDDDNELFKFSISNGLDDLAEYLYIHKEIIFELNSYIDLCNLIKEDKYKLYNINIINKYKVYNRIIKLKKYSKYYSKDKKFYYTFNKKYISKIYENII
jgi:hypothetical protein